jgi:hypothetical protein
MDHAYGEDFYAGDEDNGEMGSWSGATDERIRRRPTFTHVCA